MCHCTSPKDNKSKKSLQKRTEDMLPTLQYVSIYLFLVWLWATSLSPWRYCRENSMDCMKNFWIHQLLGFSSLTDRHWTSATLLCGCWGWRNSDSIGGRRYDPHLWIFPEHQTKTWNWGFSAVSEGEEAISTSCWEGQTEGVLWWRWCWRILPVVG